MSEWQLWLERLWDLRLIGMCPRVPIAEFHRLVPFSVLGFALNAASGSMFLMTEPDQYIYNPAFHFKRPPPCFPGEEMVGFLAGRAAPGLTDARADRRR